MFIDLTIRITPEIAADAMGNEKKALAGHLGTHFDVMDKEFPLENLERKGIVFDVSSAAGREIIEADIDSCRIRAGMFVAFHTGFIEAEEYGGRRYFSEHLRLSEELIQMLLDKRISLIGLDFAGMRRGAEHTPADQRCADRGVFIVENLCNLREILEGKRHAYFTAHTYPVNYSGMTGLPCRVVAEIDASDSVRTSGRPD